jgi:hypothetical protein
VRLRVHTPKVPPAGTPIILRHGDRIAPAIAAADCRDLRIDSVTIHQASGMAVVCQRCHDVAVTATRVVPSQGRPLSANHDAFHFLSCRGTVRVEGCTATHQLDDGVNCHGLYAPIVSCAGNRILARLVHPQQRGNTLAQPGERIGLVCQDTLRTVAERQVTSALRLSSEFIELTLDGDVPAGRLAVENHDWRCDLVVRGNRFALNRARGVLPTNGGTALIEDNAFETPGTAVLITTDANFWYESGATTSIAIRNNRFTRCAVGGNGWGEALVLVDPQVRRADGPVHGAITITGNTSQGGSTILCQHHGAASVNADGNTGATRIVSRDG